jgi:hypothetical protein
MVDLQVHIPCRQTYAVTVDRGIHSKSRQFSTRKFRGNFQVRRTTRNDLDLRSVLFSLDGFLTKRWTRHNIITEVASNTNIKVLNGYHVFSNEQQLSFPNLGLGGSRRIAKFSDDVEISSKERSRTLASSNDKERPGNSSPTASSCCSWAPSLLQRACLLSSLCVGESQQQQCWHQHVSYPRSGDPDLSFRLSMKRLLWRSPEFMEEPAPIVMWILCRVRPNWCLGDGLTT